MTIESIYNQFIDIINSNMDATKIIKLRDNLEQAIRENTCYKHTPKTRVNAIKRVASKDNIRPALKGYGVCGNYKCITDSYHAVMLLDDNIPLKLTTDNRELAEKVGTENCIYGSYPDFTKIIDFNKDNYTIKSIDLDDIEQYYKLHKKNAKEEPYLYEGYLYNIQYLKNVIDVLGTDIKVYVPINDYRPLYIENNKGEIGLVLPIKQY